MMYKKKERKLYAPGSATVEMSILMPLLTVLFILLLFLGIYLYDQLVVYCDAYLAAMDAVSKPQLSNEEAYMTAKERLNAETEKGIAAVQTLDTEIRVEWNTVTIACYGQMQVPAVSETGFFPEWKIFYPQATASASRHEPVTFIRQCRKLEQLLQEKEGESDGTEQTDG